MIRVIAYIRSHQLEEVKTAVANLDVTGLSVSDVRGCGNSPERPSMFGGDEIVIALPLRSKIEVVARDDLQEPIIEAIVRSARTGEPNDGKIFVERVQDAIRVRTSERGETAI